MAKKMGGLAKAARRKMRKRAAGMEVRRKREFTYRGYTLDELRAMTLQEVIELLPARARRTYIRGLDEQQSIFVERLRSGEWADTALRTHCRDVPILPDFVGKKVSVHNGKEFQSVEIKPEMIGHYVGEFAMTRKSVVHSGPGVGATRSSKFMPLK
ncbi:MAG TPA: 30S ribosomal protein S19 [Thermoplasmata archaeon]|nr:30S ribosomal protein S19 [Thermoplasmata archaeon]